MPPRSLRETAPFAVAARQTPSPYLPNLAKFALFCIFFAFSPSLLAKISTEGKGNGLMGASESVISNLQQQAPIDQITTVSERTEDTDPILERIQALKIATPLLRSQPSSEGSFTDIIVRKPSSSSHSTIPGQKFLSEYSS